MNQPACQPGMCQMLERRLHLDGNDFNGDDNTDLLYHDQMTGQVTVVYLNHNERVISSATIATVANLDWKVVAVGDFDGNDRPDLLWHNETTNHLLIWRLNNRQILGFTTLPAANPSLWELAGAAEVDDADSNGPGHQPDHFALLWRHVSDGRLVLWQMDGRVIQRTMQLPLEPNSQWEVAGVGEVELEPTNADLQILWRHATTGDNRVWRIDNGQLAGVVNLPRVGTAWSVAAFLDADGDDDEGDIIWRNYTTGQNLEWEFDDGYVRTEVDILPAEPNVNRVLFVGFD